MAGTLPENPDTGRQEFAASFFLSSFFRVLIFITLAAIAFQFGWTRKTALPYHPHSPVWDSLATAAPWLIPGLLIPLVVFLNSCRVSWYILSLISASVMSFLSGWGFRFFFLK